MKKLLLLFTVLAVLSCSKNGDDDNDPNSKEETEEGGVIPSQLLGKTIVLDIWFDDKSGQDMSVTPISGSKCNVTFMTNGVNDYVYQKISANSAAFTVTGRQLMPSNTYVYWWVFTLTYTANNKGTVTGTYTNSKSNSVWSLTGTFFVK